MNVKEYILADESNFLTKVGVSSKEVDIAEGELGFEFDSDYKKYLIQYGLLSYKSMETMGLGVKYSSYRNVINATKEVLQRCESFPSNAVIFEDIGEENYSIYIMNKGMYQFSETSIDHISNTIEEYLLLRFAEVTA